MNSQSIDFENSFAQEDIPIGELFLIGLPSYFKSYRVQCDVVIRLKKIIYGQAVAAHLLYGNFRKCFLDCDFVVRNMNPCLFMSKTVICVVYVGYCHFWEHKQSDINKFINYVKYNGPSYNLEHSKEDSVYDFLGI